MSYQFNVSQPAFYLNERHVNFDFNYFVKFRAVFITKGVILQEIAKVKDFEFLIEQFGTSRADSLQEFNFGLKYALHNGISVLIDL
jgi:hypothetical protein